MNKNTSGTTMHDEFDRIKAKLRATEKVLQYREAELLELKGPCSSQECRLHYAHRGPCDTK